MKWDVKGAQVATPSAKCKRGRRANAQAGGGDSGGGVFWKEGDDWVLGGIILTTGTYSGQPSSTSVYGDATYAANLNTYSSQISSIIPEPSSAMLVLAGVGLLARRRRV